MKGVALLLLVAACSAEHLTKENVEALDSMLDLAGVVDAKDEESVEAVDKVDKVDKEDNEPHRPALHLPSIPSFQIVPQIQFPGFHFPPIHLPQLPQLPSLPQFNLPELPKPFQKKETIFKTKTVYVEHTHRVTKHPVCVTAYVPKPACLFDYEVKDIQEDREFDEIVAAQRADEIRPTSVISELPAQTRIIESLDDSEGDSVNEAIEDQMATYRRARYLVPHPVRSNQDLPDASSVATEPLVEPSSGIRVKPIEQHIQVPHGHPINPQHHKPGISGLGVHQDFGGAKPQHDEHHGEDHEIVHGLLKVTHLVTKTLVVTNVQKIIDNKVTATLIAKNCLPSEYIIPHCVSHHGSHLFKEGEGEQQEMGGNPRIGDDEKQLTAEYEERK
ncbi:hypothetical protein GE061_004369 [Apolygus lucorum]|uniref:Uncharacterized protein n=1 Tax=Apolygus lucorum TaxID=248454 RepID=A0A8S9WZ71_APOLU|nr:hypothetical protein GE061_004369 [Apolygus lucorum]